MTRAAAGASQKAPRRAQQLAELVQDFRTTASTSGIRVDILDPDTQLVSQAVFYLDKLMETITIVAAFSAKRTFSPKDIAEVLKERDFAMRVPQAAHVCSSCVGIKVAAEPDEVTCFRFPDKASRDDFYACLKVVTMTSTATIE